MNNNNALNLAISGWPEPPQRRGILYVLEKVPYEIAWQWQKRLVSVRKEAKLSLSDSAAMHGKGGQSIIGLQDVLMLLEHPPVYTLGQGADTRFLKFDPEADGYELHRIERGGEVTYHCPGQLVGYPILDLQRHRQDLHWYLRQLEEVIIRTLDCYGLKGDRVAGLTGVWLEGRKVAAVGIKVSRWITMHGFALNVCPDLAGFEKIVPCGIEGKPVGSLAQFLPGISLVEVRKQLIEQFEAVFDLRLDLMPLPSDWQNE